LINDDTTTIASDDFDGFLQLRVAKRQTSVEVERLIAEFHAMDLAGFTLPNVSMFGLHRRSLRVFEIGSCCDLLRLDCALAQTINLFSGMGVAHEIRDVGDSAIVPVVARRRNKGSPFPNRWMASEPSILLASVKRE
jgi:hypothetical protein